MASVEETSTLFLLLLASFTLVRAILSKVQTRTRTRTRTRLPPSPRALPVIGHMHLLSPVLPKAFHRLSTRYGPILHLFIGSNPSILVSSPEIAKEILKTNESNFLNRPKVANLDYLTYGTADFATAPYGPHWKFMKKLCMTELLGTRTLDRLSFIRDEERRRFLRMLLEKADGSNEAVDLGAALMRLTNNIITRMALSQRCSEDQSEAEEVRKLVKELNQLGAKFNLSDSFWFFKHLDLQGFGKRLKEARDRFDVMMERILTEREEAKKSAMADEGVQNILDILLDIYEEDENSEKRRLTRENVKAFIMNIFGAGTDTSSITVEWGLAELINHPETLRKLREEIDSVVGKERLVAESDLENLPYLQAVVKEILRLHPTGPLIVRESEEECEIAGYRIPARTRVFINIWSLGRDPNYWEGAAEFKPERFLKGEWEAKNEMVDVRGQCFHMLPFGSGRRSCPGATMALRLVPATLAVIVQCFDLEIRTGDDGGVTGPLAVDMEEGPGLTLPRANPLLCVPLARLHPFPSI